MAQHFRDELSPVCLPKERFFLQLLHPIASLVDVFFVFLVLRRLLHLLEVLNIVVVLLLDLDIIHELILALEEFDERTVPVVLQEDLRNHGEVDVVLDTEQVRHDEIEHRILAILIHELVGVLNDVLDVV